MPVKRFSLCLELDYYGVLADNVCFSRPLVREFLWESSWSALKTYFKARLQALVKRSCHLGAIPHVSVLHHCGAVVVKAGETGTLFKIFSGPILPLGNSWRFFVVTTCC